jgi:SAM-dependent methyltransferase
MDSKNAGSSSIDVGDVPANASRRVTGLSVDPWTEEELSFFRRKQRSVAISVAYRGMRLARAMVGPRLLLKACLFGSWLLHRFALELSYGIFGDRFRQTAFALTERSLAPLISDSDTVLDLGCGIGRWTRVAARHAAAVVGVDYDATLIDEARRLTTDPTVEFVVGDVTRPLSEVVGGRIFDLVLLLHIVEHIEDADGFLRSLADCARRVVVEVPDFESDYLNPVRWAVGSRFYSDADHVREYTIHTLSAQLQRTGWRLDHFQQRGGCLLAVASRAHATGDLPLD